jgi:hypothetical protein
MIAVTCGKVYHIKFKLPFEIEAEKTEALFLSKSRELKIRVFLRRSAEEAEAVAEARSESILEKNQRKVREQKIEIKSALLDDLF